MNQTNYLKLFSIIAFIALAAISCWATAESLHLLLASWPLIMCWVVTIAFFIIASYGTKLIVDSLNSQIYIEKRGAKLIGGILIILFFWLVCSMPTNTHTFFYRSVISDKVNDDIVMTSGYLGQIVNNTSNKTRAEQAVSELNNKVEIKLGQLENEIKNSANPGFGPKSKELLAEFATMLNVPEIKPLSFKSTSKQGRDALCDSYRKMIFQLRDSRASVIRSSILSPNPDIIKKVKVADANLAETKKGILEGTIDLNESYDINNYVCDKLNNGYNLIKQNKDFVSFSSPEDEAIYTAQNPVTKVKRMISVVDVWKDFINGEYAGRGFIFWVFISILVDVAAFIFFDIAFKKTDF